MKHTLCVWLLFLSIKFMESFLLFCVDVIDAFAWRIFTPHSMNLSSLFIFSIFDEWVVSSLGLFQRMLL